MAAFGPGLNSLSGPDSTVFYGTNSTRVVVGAAAAIDIDNAIGARSVTVNGVGVRSACSDVLTISNPSTPVTVAQGAALSFATFVFGTSLNILRIGTQNLRFRYPGAYLVTFQVNVVGAAQLVLAVAAGSVVGQAAGALPALIPRTAASRATGPGQVVGCAVIEVLAANTEIQLLNNTGGVITVASSNSDNGGTSQVANAMAIVQV